MEVKQSIKQIDDEGHLFEVNIVLSRIQLWVIKYALNLLIELPSAYKVISCFSSHKDEEAAKVLAQLENLEKEAKVCV